MSAGAGQSTAGAQRIGKNKETWIAKDGIGFCTEIIAVTKRTITKDNCRSEIRRFVASVPLDPDWSYEPEPKKSMLDKQRDADIALICAAPELLELLRDVTDRMLERIPAGQLEHERAVNRACLLIQELRQKGF